MHYRDLAARLQDRPFKPFRIRLVNSTTYDIQEPWMVMVGPSSAIVVTHTRKDDRGFELAEEWRTVSIDHMLEFSDLPTRGREKRRPA